MVIERPDEQDEVLLDRPWSGNAMQIIEDMTTCLEDFMERWELEGVRLMIHPYDEEVKPGDLPTNDFIHAVRRDLETHGKLLVRMDPRPEPEDYHKDDYQTFASVALRHEETGEEILRTFWFCQRKHEAVVKVAHAAIKDAQDDEAAD